MSNTDEPNIREEKTDAGYSENLSRNAVRRLFEGGDSTSNEPPDVTSAFVMNYNTKETPQKARPRPPVPRQVPEEPPEDEPVVDRQRRRENATTRLLHPNDEPPEPDPRERRERRRNPSPRPAVMVNVPVEHTMHEQDEPPHQPKKGDTKNRPVSEDLDTFRHRYSGELVSPPRNKNRPVRPGRTDVRTNRVRPPEYEMEQISPVRMVITIAVLVLVVLFSVITFQMLSYRGKLGEAQEALIAAQQKVEGLEAELVVVPGLRENISQLEAQKAELERQLREMQPVAPDPEATPGEAPAATPTAPAAPATPQLPTTVEVPRGGSLSSVARAYYGNSHPDTIAHIARVNGINNPDNVPAGRLLELTPMP